MKKFLSLAAFVVVAFSCAAVGPAIADDALAGLVPVEFVENPSALEIVRHAPAFVLQMIPFMIAIMVACRGLSEALLLVADKTKTKVDNQAAQALGTVAALCAQALAHVGVGMPHALVMKKAAAGVPALGTAAITAATTDNSVDPVGPA
jgi:hypothetical protein